MRKKLVFTLVAFLSIGVILSVLNYFGTSFTIGKTRLRKGEKTKIEVRFLGIPNLFPTYLDFFGGETTKIEIRFLGLKVPSWMCRYKSSFPQVATVSKSGVVKAISSESTVSTIVLAKFGLVYATFPVLVNPEPGVPLPVTNGKLTVQMWERSIGNIGEGTVTVISVGVENSSHIIGRSEKIKIDPKYFTLIDEDGATYPVDLKIAEEYQLPLKPTWLTPGNWAIGVIAFRGIEVYKGKLIYDDGRHKPVVVKFDHRAKKLSK